MTTSCAEKFSISPSPTESTSDTDVVPDLQVWWDPCPETDPQNPRNWPATVKWANILTLSVISFLVPFVSSAPAPAIPLIMTDLQTPSPLFATFSISIFVLGFASGPLLLAPLSELYGRLIIYHVTNILFLLFTCLCGFVGTEKSFLACRFLAGFFGVSTITIGPGTIADLMPREERGRAVAVWSVGTILGPTVGPVIGGLVTERAGWRWVFWGVSIPIAIVAILAFAILRETYPPVLLTQKAARLRKTTGNPGYRSRFATDESPRALFSRSIIRPTKLLLCRPLVTILCTYVAVLYATLYLLFATYSFVFSEVYGFSPLAAGLVFLPGGIGTLFGVYYLSLFSDKSVRRAASVEGKSPAPEDRLPLVITLPGALTFPAGLFMYGWSAQAKTHWIVPQIGTAVTGFGSIIVFAGIQTYLIDAFEEYAASAVGANAVLRGTAGALLPLCGLGLYDRLGWGWGNSLLGFVALGLAPVPVLFGVYGRRIRRNKWFAARI